MKRKNPASPKDGNDASRAQRKRVQNRISQKCHRERQAAHARHLESVVDIIKAGDQEGDNARDRYTKLLRQHMKIVEEKRELEEAMFRMRKKLLSISSSAAAAADDEAVDALVRPKNATKRQDHLDSPSPSPLHQQIEPNSEDSPINLDAQPHKESLPRKNVISDPPAAIASPQEAQQLSSVDSRNMYALEKDLGPPMMSWASDFELPNTPFGTCSQPPKLHDRSPTREFGALELTFPPDYQCSVSQPTTTVTVTSPAVCLETVVHACKKYVGMHTSEPEVDSTFCSDLDNCDWSQEAQVMNSIAQISEVAVHMLTVFAGLETYVYGLGASSVMESVMRWRLLPTYASRASIPEPFRPTPLQYSTSDYPLLVDFINWPSIRDQLILQSRTINIDEIVREVVQHTVVDIPHYYMSVNVFSLFYSCTLNPSNHVACNSSPRTSITDAQWKYLEIAAPSEPDLFSPNLDLTPAENVLVQEISRRMDTSNNTPSPKGNTQLAGVETNNSACSNSHLTITDSLTGSWSPAMPRRNDIISRLGLDQLSKWKLSKDFARKHTFLDCSSAVTAYDMVSVQRILEAEARAC